MPMFQTFADYDKWRRRQLLMRLESLKPAPDGVVHLAAQAGDALIKGSSRSKALQGGEAPAPIKSAPISKGLKKGLISPSYFNGMVSPALRRILRQRIIEFLRTGELPINPDTTTTGPGPNSRGGEDLVMATHDGAFSTERDGQLTGIPGGVGTDGYTMSLWINIVSQKTGTTYITDGLAANRAEELLFSSTGQITVVGKNWLGGSTGTGSTGANVLTPGQRYHLMVSINLANNEFKLWIDGTAVIDQAIAGGQEPLGNESDWIFGSNDTGLFPPDDGDQFGGYWISTEYVADPVGVFIDAAGPEPGALEGGTDGSLYTGTAPLVYFNEIADWNSGNNQGTGGDYTVKGGAMS